MNIDNEDYEDDIEIDIVDDTPEEDQNRVPLPELTEEEQLAQAEEMDKYSSKRVKERYNQLTHRYHDERRAKEEAARRAEEATNFAKQVYEENKRLKDTLEWGRNEYYNEINARLDTAQQLAEKAYREAYEAGNTDDLIKAQNARDEIILKRAQMANMPAPVPQDKFEFSAREEPPQVISQPTPEPRPENNYQEDLQYENVPDIKAEEWAARNSWFGKDDEMTALALGVHKKLVSNGYDTDSDDYYAAIDQRMREVYPNKFGKPRPSPVAPAGRTTATKKVTLTKSQVDLAKKFRIPLEVYAKEYAKTMETK